MSLVNPCHCPQAPWLPVFLKYLSAVLWRSLLPTDKVQRKKVVVMVVKALTSRETNYSLLLKCSTKLLFVAIEFSFFFSSHFIPWWIWNALEIFDRFFVPSMLLCAWSMAVSLSLVADSVREHTASAPNSWRCLGSLGLRIWSAPGEQIWVFSRIQDKIFVWSGMFYDLKQTF